MKSLALLLALVLAACGNGEDTRANVTAEQIERLALPPETKSDPLAAVRLEPIASADLEREGVVGVGCAFTRDRRLLLATAGSNAVVRIGGTVRHLVNTGPIGPSGGFFEDRQLTVSVGRTSAAGTGGDEAGSWPAHLRVGHRRGEVHREYRGVWTCGV
jgi:hypothetical protein